MGTISTKWIIIILSVIIAALIAGFWWWDHSKLKKASAEWQTMYYACKNAPADTVIRYDTILQKGETFVKIVPVRIVVHDSIMVPLTECWYDSIFDKGGMRFRYLGKGCIDYIKFSEFVWPKEIMTITRHVDTCLVKEPPKQPTFRIGPYAGVTLNSFAKFPGFELGGQLVFKDQVTLSVGGLYLDGLYGNVRIGWLIKR